jgi:tripartite ATP-independent transporter DctM subunit
MALVGHIRGGLGYVTIVASILLSALSGSAVADAAALTTMLLPMMVAAGHAPHRAAGLIAGSGVIAPVLPPSIGLIIFGVTANVSISKLFMAGIVPGLLMGLSLCITWAIVARNEGIVPPPRKPLRELLVTARRCGWALMLPVIILVGLRMGVFTPTEAGVVAASMHCRLDSINASVVEFTCLAVFVTAARPTAVIMFLVAAAMVSAWLITVANIPAQMISLLEPFMGNQTLLLVAIMVLVMAVGTAMDMTPTILILTPVLMPVVLAAGIDPVYFGVMFIMNNAIGLVTPPVGVVLNVVAGVGRISMDTVTKGVMPFMTAQFLIMFLMVFFPWLVTVPAKLLFHGVP